MEIMCQQQLTFLFFSQCFDLESYLKLNCERGNWKCPVCRYVEWVLIVYDVYLPVCWPVSVCLSVCLSACLPSSFPTYCLSFSLQQSCLVGGIRSGSVHVGNSDIIIKVSWCQICLHLVCMCHCCVCNTLAPQWSVVGLFHPKLFVCFLVRHPLQMYIARLP